MERREEIIRLWFSMWLQNRDLGLDEIFTDGAVYVESWGPEYHGSERIRHWFNEWNTRGRVLQWEIRQFIHAEQQTVVEWYFKNIMNTGEEEAFDGISLVKWTEGNQICFLKEFGCNESRYDPYQEGPYPHFREEKTLWF
ncbi:nuclear transport factor 2 family protein [Bacteroides heparinolyticus]|uniref:nuclear transport factor 2 family protein n=2 Tax=Prevotella heparinolytica TaxID=28113 RepID=UPI0035A010B8